MDEKVKKEQNLVPQKKPDEQGGVHVESHIKIYDPQTKEIFVKGRA